MTSQQRILSECLLRRCRLLDAARGLLRSKDHPERERARKRPPLPAFALQSHHFGQSLVSASPRDFHSTLCDLIRKAKKRVYIASLYIGPAASSSKQEQPPQERALLEALQHVSSHNPEVSVQIVLDENRALRSVPTTTMDGEPSSTSSAQAVAQAIQRPPQDKDQQDKDQHQQLYLFQVLSSPLATMLPNPLNEVAGVFHIKLYIVDDSLILSGANLSEEYFVDRQDRYLWICKGGNGLVDFYAQLLQVLCRHSKAYNHYDNNDDDHDHDTKTKTSSREEFLQQITNLFQDPEPESAKDLLSDPDTVAVCVPTFHAPQGFWSSTTTTTPDFVSDVEATLGLLEEGQNNNCDDENDNHNHNASRVQLSSAYLNPTSDLIQALAKYPHVDLLTAGRLSHGFRPKSSSSSGSGNKGKDWIPTVFDHLQRDTCQQLPHAQIHHWEREDWTFHAKGLWIQQQQQKDQDQTLLLAAAIVGSSNFGGRSFVRDMESNLVLVFPPPSSSPNSNSSISGNPNNHNHTAVVGVGMAESLQDEWKQLLASSKTVDTKGLVESAPPLPIHIRSLYPYIKSFF